MLCIAALSIHDKIYTPLYTSIIDEWIIRVKAKLDRNGLIPHSVDPLTAEPLEDARGSSQSLMLIFLHEINAKFAQQQFEIYERKFFDNRFGLSGIREYPVTENGDEDVDSGPVIFGMGSAATIVGMCTMRLYNSNKKNVGIENTIEALGLSIKISDRKIYWFGALPIADAFICWAHSHTSLVNNDSPDFIAFHLYSLFLTLVLLVLIYFFLKSEKPSSERSLNIPW